MCVCVCEEACAAGKLIEECKNPTAGRRRRSRRLVSLTLAQHTKQHQQQLLCRPLLKHTHSAHIHIAATPEHICKAAAAPNNKSRTRTQKPSPNAHRVHSYRRAFRRARPPQSHTVRRRHPAQQQQPQQHQCIHQYPHRHAHTGRKSQAHTHTHIHALQTPFLVGTRTYAHTHTADQTPKKGAHLQNKRNVVVRLTKIWKQLLSSYSRASENIVAQLHDKLSRCSASLRTPPIYVLH